MTTTSTTTTTTTITMLTIITMADQSNANKDVCFGIIVDSNEPQQSKSEINRVYSTMRAVSQHAFTFLERPKTVNDRKVGLIFYGG